MVFLLFTVFTSTVFTCRSYEYQIILAKQFIIVVVFAHTIERYKHSEVTDGIDRFDKEPHQGIYERSHRGKKIPI